MKSFWALPVLIRVAVASRNVFSVNDDVLAYPQVCDKYELLQQDRSLTVCIV